MALTTYREKRSFRETPEPTGGKAIGNELRFVIQKHAASHLHYDFRLEMQGVLKSWAVPKGPSTDPDVKRLAMMVEDHPYDYRNFEGIIPKGQYGGGTVIVWDEGTYTAAELEEKDKKLQEKDLLRQLKSGRLKINLDGKKLKGAYALVKASGRGENAWLLMKLNDQYAATSDITKKEKSVQSGKTLLQVEKTTKHIYGRKTIEPGTTMKDKKNNPVKAKEKVVIEEPALPEQKLTDRSVAEILSKAKKAAFPANIQPMLTTLVDQPFDEEGWEYEIKWDGYRALAYINKGKVELRSRNNKSFDEKFYPIYDSLKKAGINAILDGEVIVANDEGHANFGNLQNWRSEADGRLLFYVFDILWLNGKSLMELPLNERRAVLESNLPAEDNIILSKSFKASGTEFFAIAEKMGLEGIIAKRTASPYLPGDRSRNWLKIKTSLRQEVVIGGFTRNDGSSKLFSSLLVGVFEKDKLVYTGKIGTGFTDKLQKEMMAQFKPLIIDKSPFTSEPDINKPSRFRHNPPNAEATWLQPKLICEVSFREMTTDGVMRHPSFEGMREDKNAKEVVMEKQAPTKEIVKGKKKVAAGKPIISKPGKEERKTLLNPTDETQVRNINGHDLKFTNLSKLYWPKDNITKRDMLNYYYQVAPYILPYLKNRPQSLNRHPNGINGMSFYQKDVTGKVPDWIKTFPYTTEGENKNFMVCDDEASLLYMASLGCIELNPWSSRVTKPDHPDWCIIDLDPGKKNTFEQVIETANVTKQILDAASIDAYCKTSGSTGLHIYIPLGAKYIYEESKEFARLIARMVTHELPGFTSIERIVNKRKGKLYVDFLQNRPQATLATVYSLRPKPKATVSIPLHWEEVKKGLQMTDFTIKNAIDRIKETGDIFKPVLGKGINMKTSIANLKKAFEIE